MGRKIGYKIFLYTTAIFILVTILFPILWIFLTSFKSESELSTFPPVLWPSQFNFNNYIEVLIESKYGVFAINSLIIGIAATTLVLILAVLSAYGYSKFFRFKEQKLSLVAVLIARMAPPIAIVVPLYQVVQRLGLYDTKIALILIYSAVAYPLATWLLKTFFDDIPESVVESAIIDGCSKLQVLIKIILPLSTPALASTVTITFLTVWNRFLIALTFSATTNSKTLPVAISALSHAEYGVQWGNLSAISIVTVIPVFLIGLGAQKYLTAGLTAGAEKY